MKKPIYSIYLLSILIFCLFYNNSYSQWEAANTGMGNGNLRINAIADYNGKIFAGTDSGIFISTNYGNDWIVSNIGLTNTHVTCFAINENYIYASTTDKIFITTNYGSNWVQINQSGPAPDIRYLTINGNNFFTATFVGAYLSTDNGVNWINIMNQSTAYLSSIAINGNNIFEASYINGIYLSTNNGRKWTEVNNGLTNTGVYNITINNNKIFAGTEGGAFVSSNNGSNWTHIKNGLNDTIVTSFAFSGSNILAGTYSEGIFLSTNNGSTWTQINNGLTDTEIWSLKIKDNFIFAGTDGTGIFKADGNDFVPLYISKINDINMNHDTNVNINLSITVFNPDMLQFSVSSDNADLLVPDSIKILPNGDNRVMQITPTKEKFGEANITLIVSNGEDTVSTSFKVTVYKFDFTINGSTTACQNDTLDYSTSVETNVSITWRADSGNIIGPNNNNNIKVQWNKTGTGQLVLIKKNLITGKKDSVSQSITIYELPPKPTISKNINTLTSSAAEGNQWYIKGNPITGATSNTFGARENGKYSVKVTLNGCSSIFSDDFDFIYTGYFDLTITGTTSLCQNDTTLYNAITEKDVIISWRVDNGSIIGSNNDSTLEVLWNLSGIGNVVLVKENTTLSEKDSSNLSVYVNPSPIKPIITKNLNTLISSDTLGNQWYKNNLIIPGAINQSYDATEDGKYSVQSTQDSCHSLMSDEYDFVYTGVNDIIIKGTIYIFPNPADSRLSIVSTSNVPLGKIELYNILGTKVFIREEQNNKAELDISTLQSGIYLIKIGDYRKIIVKN